jgi:hypothetical protein
MPTKDASHAFAPQNIGVGGGLSARHDDAATTVPIGQCLRLLI